MALVVADRARDTTTTTGTGTVTLSGTAPSGYQAFSVIGNGNTTYYTIVGGSEWEVGTGTYASSGPTLARTTVLASSNGGSAVSFSSGTKDVFVTYPAEIATMLGNSATGTGSVVLSASPTLSGTLTAATGTFSGLITASAGVSSTLTTDATSATTGSIITAGGISMQKALWVGTTSRHVGAATFDSTIAATSGSFSSASVITTSTFGFSGPRLFVDSGGPTGILYGGASQLWFYAGGTHFAIASTSTLAFQTTYNITAGGSFTGTNFTATATGNNGLGLAAANTPAFYASTTEVMRSTSALTTFALAASFSSTIKATTGMAVGGATPGSGGIAFPAAAVAVADANTLDDYEEGTFTPGLIINNNSSPVGLTYLSRTGMYTKIGSQVNYVVFLTLSAKGSTTGNVQLGGFPFSPAGQAIGASASNVVAVNNAKCIFQGGNSTVDVWAAATVGTNWIYDSDLTNTTTLFFNSTANT